MEGGLRQSTRIIAMLPATSSEIATELGSTVRRINAHLQDLKNQGICRPTDKRVRPLEKRCGRWPLLWERT